MSDDDSNDEAGIEVLRAAVDLFNNCNESFAWPASPEKPFTPEQLIQLYRMHEASEWTIPPDRWTKVQVKLALDGHPPKWFKDETPNETAAKLRRLTPEEAERMGDIFAMSPLGRRPIDDALFAKGWLQKYDGAPGDDAVEPSREAYEQRELPEGENDPAVPALYRSDGCRDEQWLLPTWGTSLRDAEMFALHMRFFETNPEFADAVCAAWAARNRG